MWESSPFSGAVLLVHLALADVANDAHENELWMSVGAIAKKARVSRSTAFAALRELCDHGFLELLESGQGARKPSRYYLRTSPEIGLDWLSSPESGLTSPTTGTPSPTSGLPSPEVGRVTKRTKEEPEKNSSEPISRFALGLTKEQRTEAKQRAKAALNSLPSRAGVG